MLGLLRLICIAPFWLITGVCIALGLCKLPEPGNTGFIYLGIGVVSYFILKAIWLSEVWRR